MLYYINNKDFDASPQVLEIESNNERYAFSVMNAGTEVIKTEGVRYASPYKKRQHSHSVYHVVLYWEGETGFVVDGKLHKGVPGVLALTSPGEPHCFCLGEKGGTVVYKCFSFILESVNGLGQLELPFHKILSLYSGMNLFGILIPVKLSDRQFHKIGELIEKAAERLVLGDAFSQFSTCSAILELFGALIHELFAPGRREAVRRSSPLSISKEMIEKDYNKKLSIKDLAKASSLSEGYFIRAFRKAYKTSPIDYQMELRINAAKSYLSTTELPIKEISTRAGFSDVYYFSKTFKARAGVPPSKFRKLSQIAL